QACERAGRPSFLIDVRGLDELPDQAKLIVRVENGEVRLEARQLGMSAQHARANRVKGAKPLHALDHAADQRTDALLHLARGFVGESDRKDLPGPGAPRREDMG